MHSQHLIDTDGGCNNGGNACEMRGDNNSTAGELLLQFKHTAQCFCILRESQGGETLSCAAIVYRESPQFSATA